MPGRSLPTYETKKAKCAAVQERQEVLFSSVEVNVSQVKIAKTTKRVARIDASELGDVREIE